MSWYYAEDTQRMGPVDEDAFDALIASGKIKSDTLVWQEGMPNWQPLAQVPRDSGSGAAALAEAPCAECGRSFSVDEMVSYDGRYICPTCKPIFFQKVKEGAVVPGNFNYAGFWVRFGAYFIDSILLQIFGALIGFIVGFIASGSQAAPGIAMGLAILLGLSYEIYFIGKYGATPGKMALKLRVIRADGSPVGFGLAAGRYFSKILSAMILLIGFIMAGFDEQKRALHDRICETRVIRE